VADIEGVTSRERHDLDEEARAAFRATWPEFIFHDPVSAQYIDRVRDYFPYYDGMLLDQVASRGPGQSPSAGTGR